MIDDRLDLGDDDAFEGLLEESLSAAGRPAPFPVDVTGAVMARVLEFGPVSAREVGPGELRFWWGAATALAVVLLAMGISSAPSPAEIVRGLGGAAGLAAGFAARLGLALTAILEPLGRAAAALFEGLSAAAAPLAPAAPVATAVLTAAAAAALGAATFIVGRDLLARGPRKENA